MSSDYNRPLQRARRLGTGFLAGRGANDPEVQSSLRANIQYRVDSLRAMVSGNREMSGAQPGERRREIMKRRRNALGVNMGGGEDMDTSSSDRSGSIGAGGSTSNQRTVDESTSSPTTMSNVDRGTRARALERGYDG